jgi:hypothetical protein
VRSRRARGGVGNDKIGKRKRVTDDGRQCTGGSRDEKGFLGDARCYSFPRLREAGNACQIEGPFPNLAWRLYTSPSVRQASLLFRTQVEEMTAIGDQRELS